jgi:hypothetical protein
MKTELSKQQMERKIQTAVVFVPKDKDTKSIFFSDKGLRLTVTSEYAVVSTAFHSHVFANATKPYIYIGRLVDIAYNEDCVTDDGEGYSVAKLLDSLHKGEKKDLENLVQYISWYLFNIFAPLYSIGESQFDSFSVFVDYAKNIAKQHTLLKMAEKGEEVTGRTFLEEYSRLFNEITEPVGSEIILTKKEDETEEFAEAMSDLISGGGNEQ